MASCSYCRNLIDQNALRCPYCQKTLKAFGHPGIPLHQATDDQFLCDRCTYHHDDTCTYPQRPYAKTCTLFHDHQEPLVEKFNAKRSLSGNPLQNLKRWMRRHQRVLLFLGLIVISGILAFISLK